MRNLEEAKKVLLLSCGTGGGHNIAAKAIQESLQEKGIQADFMEYLDIISPTLKDKINNLYLRTTEKEGRVFKKVYRLGELYQKTKLKSPVYGLNRLSRRKLYAYITENKYSYVVTTHLFAAEALTAIKKEHEIHFMEIATDYVSIPFWEETNPDYFVIPHENLKKTFLAKGFEEEKLLPYGIPVFQKYSKTDCKKACKSKLGLKIEQRYVLILNGSMGFGNVMLMTEELLKNVKDINFIIACGNNKKLLKKMQEKYQNEKRILVLAYTDCLNQYMASSEIVLSKPGGLTTTEIATMRKPMIHTMPIPGCENYNADFFEKRKMAIQCKSIQEIVEKTKLLLEDEKQRNEMIKNQEKYIAINVADKIAQFIIKQLELMGK